VATANFYETNAQTTSAITGVYVTCACVASPWITASVCLIYFLSLVEFRSIMTCPYLAVASSPHLADSPSAQRSPLLPPSPPSPPSRRPSDARKSASQNNKICHPIAKRRVLPPSLRKIRPNRALIAEENVVEHDTCTRRAD